MTKRAAVSLILGITIGILVSQFRPSDFLHSFVLLKDGEPTAPIHYKAGGARTLLLSLKNLQSRDNLAVRLDGGVIKSPIPPPVEIVRWISFDGSTFKGLKKGMTIPLVVYIDGRRHNYDMVFSEPSENKVVTTVHIMEGNGNGMHH